MRHFALTFLVLVAVLLTGGCRKTEDKSGGETTAQPAPSPSPAATTASLTGEIGVPIDVEPAGIMVFAEGTSHIAFTDSEGRYTLSGLEAAEYRLRASRVDLEPLVVGEVTVTKDDIARQQPFHQMLRVIMDKAEGASVAAAYGNVAGTVDTSIPGEEDGVIISVDGTRHRTVTVNGGQYELLNLEPGDYQLVFMRSGYTEQRVSVKVKAGEKTDVPLLKMRATSVASEVTPTIYGTVTMLTADGAPVEDYSSVRVALEGTSFITTPNSQGRYELRNLASGAFTVSASAPGYILERKFEVNLQTVPIVRADLTLIEDTTSLAEQGSLYGKVTLDDTDSYAGIAVSLAGTSKVAFTDANGEYELLSVEPGTYDLVATFNGYKPGTMEGLRVSAGDPTEAPDLQLEREVDRPRVVYTNPKDGASQVAIRQPLQLTIQFSQDMDVPSVLEVLSITPTVGFKVQRGGGGMGQAVINLSLDAIPGGSSGSILKYDTEYTVVIGGSAKSVQGVAMKDEYKFSFTTGRAMIIATEPADGEKDAGVYPNYPVKVYFNAPVDRESITADNIDITPEFDGGHEVYFRLDAETGWDVLYIRGFVKLDQDYRVRIRRGVRTVTGDRVDNVPYSFSFRTPKAKSFEEEFHQKVDYDIKERERQR